VSASERTPQKGRAIFKVDNAAGIFGLEKVFEDYLRKVFFFILTGFFLSCGFVSKNVKNCPFER
jgi:hypothetical protein